jgi:hypothetical protein
MNSKWKSYLLWVLSFVLMLSLSVYQRLTGPTNPVRGKTLIGKSEVSFKLIRTWGEDSGAKIELKIPDEEVAGICIYRRYKSFDLWDTLAMQRNGNELFAILPQLEPAGKIMYQIVLYDEEKDLTLNSEPAILRYKGSVPAFILIPHIVFMFLAMLFSIRTGLETLFVRQKTYILSLWTTIFLIAGGLILGPLVQKYAFGAYWTGWPAGTDLTDNKTAVAFIFWLIAVLVLRKNRQNRLWPLIASIILLAVYIIPHSLMGSEIDYQSKEPTQQTQ